MRALRAALLSLLVFGLAIAPAGTGATAPKAYFTTSIVLSKATQVTVNGVTGFNVTFTNELSTSITVTVFIVVLNAAGQTVLISPSVVVLQASHHIGSAEASFVGLTTLGFSAGTYTAEAFATTSNSVPLSSTVSVQVVL